MKWVVLVAMFAVGCGSTYPAKGMASYENAELGLVSAEPAPESEGWDAAEGAFGPPKLARKMNRVDASRFDEVGTPEELAGVERLLIYSGVFTVAVGNVEDAQTAAREMAEGLGGYFQSLKRATITLRVPAAKWEEAVAAVAGLGRVLDRAIDAADVTEEVVDLRLRLRNAQAMMQRLEQLLAKAENVEAALKVEKELGRIREEVERLEGRLSWLGDRVAFSTLVITFVQTQQVAARPASLPFDWLGELSLESLLGLPGGA